MGCKNRSVRNHFLLCPPAPDNAATPTHSALLTCTCRLIKPKPPYTMFPKHALITINQRTGVRLPAWGSILLMMRKGCQTASSAAGGGGGGDVGLVQTEEAKASPTNCLAWKGDPWRLIMRNEQASHAPQPPFTSDDPGDPAGWRESSGLKGG